MTLAAAVAAKKKGNGSSASSQKTPAFYNREKSALITDLCGHEDPVVRIAVLTNIHCPASKVNSSLKDEASKEVLREVLLSGRPSIKAIEEFAVSARGSMFDGDQEVEDHIKARIAGEEEDKTPPSDEDGNDAMNTDED